MRVSLPSWRPSAIWPICAALAVLQPALVYAQSDEAASVQWASADSGWFEEDMPGASENEKLIDTALPVLKNMQAAQSPDSVGNQTDGMFVGAIAINGADQLSQEIFAPLVENNIGRNLAEKELRELTQQIAEMAHDRGYIFATAKIPEQSLSLGILQVEFIEGVIDEVRISGSDNKALHRLLKSIEGQPAVQSQIERKLVLANDIPQVWVKKTRYLSEGGRNILAVEIGERSNKIRIGLDNYGSKGLGPLRARLSFDFRGLLDGADQAGVSFRTNPTDPAEFVYANAYYSTGIGNNGTRVGVSGSIGVTEPGNRNFNNLEGDSFYLSLFGSHPLIRSDAASLWLNTEVSYLSIEQDDLNALVNQDKQATFSVGLAANIKLLGGRFRSGASLVQGLDLFDITRLGDPSASRFDGDGLFTKGRFYANWRGDFSKNWGLYLGAWGQIANKPLLASQEINIGGAYSARGYNFSEVSGENGFAALLEINRTFVKPTSWIKKLQPFMFIDGGYVDNLRNGFGSGTLASSGGGIRADIGKFNLEVEAAVPLNRNRFESGDRSPQVNVQLGLEI